MKISLENVELSFGERSILNGITIDFPENKITGIIGPNGSGKSTLLKCIYRVLETYKGCIYVNNNNLKEYSYKETAKLQSVLAQHSAGECNFSVFDVVLMGRTPYKGIFDRDNDEDYELAAKNLNLVGMTDFADKTFDSLSGGEKQRVLLARAFTQNTECLILDEPTNHLDIKYQLDIFKLIKARNLTVISAIHDLNIAAMYCDYIIAMLNGKVVKQGTTREVLNSEIIKKLYDVNADVIEYDENRKVIIYKV